MEGKFYTIDQVADILGMHHKTIRKFINNGKLPANKIGKQWRITSDDLNVFMGKNTVNTKKEERSKVEGIEFSKVKDGLGGMKSKINISSVIDINDIDKESYLRLSNTLLAIMNTTDSKMENSTINMKYYEDENRLRVMLWGGTKFMEEMISLISMLLEQP